MCDDFIVDDGLLREAKKMEDYNEVPNQNETVIVVSLSDKKLG